MARSKARSSPTLCDRIVIAVTGSIAALWAGRFILHLRAEGYVREVSVIMSDHAMEFVTAAAMRAISGAPVITSLFDVDAPLPVGHVQVTEGAGALIVMPATANIIGKAAGGIADDAVSSSILAAACPVIFVPNMNERMWRHPIVRRNVKTLESAGYHVVPPESGVEVSTLRAREGAMASFDAIIAATRAAVR
jgi:phosphopantothenoylcysteine decarboxylase/phosphopantothenate--cysteine ligase